MPLGHAHAPERRVGRVATTSARGSALPTSSLAKMSMRREHEERVVARLEHAHHPVDRRVGIAAAHRLDERADDVVVLLAGLVVEERRGGSRPRPRPRAVTLRLARRASSVVGHDLERRQRAPRVAAGRLGDGARARRRRPSRCCAPRPCSSSRERAPRGARRGRPPRAPRGGTPCSARAARRSRRRSGSRSSRRRATIVPSSTCGRNASCCALLKRWISSTKTIVRWPVEREALARRGDDLAQLADAAEHGAERHEVRLASRAR